MNLLDVRNLDVTLAPLQHILHSLNFSIREGEVVALVGGTGSGKSLTAKSIMRLLPPNTQVQGSILLEGEELLTCSEKRMRQLRGSKMGMIFQDPMTSLNPTMRIGHQILEVIRRNRPLLSKQDAMNLVYELLEYVQIPSAQVRAREFSHTLSGGMRQRVMIAQALANSPKLLLADEPTTALDVTTQAQILTLLKDLRKAHGLSILLITHDLSLVAGFCDRVLVLQEGKLVESSSVDDLFYRPSHAYTKILLQAVSSQLEDQ